MAILVYGFPNGLRCAIINLLMCFASPPSKWFICYNNTRFMHPFRPLFFCGLWYMKLIKTEMNLFLAAKDRAKIYCIRFLYFIDFNFVYVFRCFFPPSLFYLLALLINVILWWHFVCLFIVPYFHLVVDLFFFINVDVFLLFFKTK